VNDDRSTPDSAIASSVAEIAGRDPRQMGKWLQHARKAAGRSQQEVADFLGVARTTVTAMEKGERRLQPAELLRMGHFYGRQLADLLRPDEPDEAFAIQLRAAIAPHEDVSSDLIPAATEFQQLSEDYLELERITSSERRRRYPPEREVPRADVERAAEDLAIEERQRLGLGDGPMSNLREVLEQDVGARIFCIPMPSRVDAMFAYTERLGPCIAVNAKHPEERRRTSIAHEWGHFLTARRQGDVEIRDRFERIPALERFANAFARSFLMPAAGLTRRYNETKRARGGTATVADLLTLSHYFNVSFETLTRRLEELRLITSGTMDRMRHSRFAVREGRAILGLAESVSTESMLPIRYVHLAVQGYRDGLLSEGRLARFLRLDRVEARRVVQEVAAPMDAPDASDAGKL
jgi:Zn-dependent peptidase ImmA (M78 family)/DNA-binding XRE family transcriptional regulator